jgi:hypothetical protein
MASQGTQGAWLHTIVDAHTPAHTDTRQSQKKPRKHTPRHQGTHTFRLWSNCWDGYCHWGLSSLQGLPNATLGAF